MRLGKLEVGGLWDLQEMWAEGKGRLQQLKFCCRDRDEAERLSLEKREQ